MRTKLPHIKNNSINKSNTFIEVTSPGWRNSNKISIEDLLNDVMKFNISDVIDHKTIKFDTKTLKIKVADIFKNNSDVHYDAFSNHNITINKPPENASEITGLHLMSDSNYLYVWVKNKWKKIPLSI